MARENYLRITRRRRLTCNPALKSFYENNGASGDGRSANPAMENSGVPTLKTGETPQSSYPGTVTSTYGEYDDAAIVVFSRIAGENWDLPRKADDNENRHYLELDNNERDLLTSVCNGPFKHVIVLMNSSNYIDLGFLEMTNDPAYNAKIDAAINIGSPGANGIMALGRILRVTLILLVVLLILSIPIMKMTQHGKTLVATSPKMVITTYYQAEILPNIT